MGLNVICNDDFLEGSEVWPNFTLSTFNGGVKQSLDVNLETLQKHSTFFKQISAKEKTVTVYGANAQDLSAIVDYCVSGKCLVSESRLYFVCRWSKELEFDTLHKKLQDLISGQRQENPVATVADFDSSSGEDDSEMIIESEDIFESQQRTVEPHQNSQRGSQEKETMMGSGDLSDADSETTTRWNKIYELLEIIEANESHGETLDAPSELKIHENAFEKLLRLAKAAEEEMDSDDRSDVDSHQTFQWKYDSCELTQMMVEARESEGQTQNATENENGDITSDMVKMEVGNNVNSNVVFDSETESGHENEQESFSVKQREAVDDITSTASQMTATYDSSFDAAYADMEESYASDEDPLFSPESPKSTRNKWTAKITKAFVGIWHQSITDSTINLRAELAKRGFFTSTYTLRNKQSSFRRKFKAYINGKKQPVIKPYLKLMKRIFAAERGSFVSGRKRRPRKPVVTWTKDMVDILFHVWAKYARRGLVYGSWGDIASEVVHKLAQRDILVTQTQVTNKKSNLLKLYREHQRGKKHYSILPYVPLLNRIRK